MRGDCRNPAAAPDDPQTLLARLIRRGDSVAFEGGRLTIRPASGSAVPDDWLRDNGPGLEVAALRCLGLDAFRYDSFSTGAYGARRSDGVTLQLVSALTGEAAYCVFNAIRRYQRGPKNGAPLPGRRFGVGRRSAFLCFWRQCGLTVPQSLTSFHDYMGKLHPLLLTAPQAIDDHGALIPNRLIASELLPLSVDAAVIARASLSDNSRITTGELPDNSRINFPDKDSAQSHTTQGFQPVSTAGQIKYGKTDTRRRGIRGNPIPHVSPETEAWLAAYEAGA